MDDPSILSLKGVTIGHVVRVEGRYEKVGHGVGGHWTGRYPEPDTLLEEFGRQFFVNFIPVVRCCGDPGKYQEAPAVERIKNVARLKAVGAAYQQF